MKFNGNAKKPIGFPSTSPRLHPTDFTKGRSRMPSGPGVVSNDTAFALQVGSRKIPLSPSQAFGLAEDLIRGATRRMIREEADRAAVLDTVREADHA
jgi:hypothetical protein